jgi:hypothetical protein
VGLQLKRRQPPLSPFRIQLRQSPLNQDRNYAAAGLIMLLRCHTAVWVGGLSQLRAMPRGIFICRRLDAVKNAGGTHDFLKVRWVHGPGHSPLDATERTRLHP